MSAVISRDGKYRYRLDRTVATSGIVVAFFGVNPSTASETVDDATSKRWVVHARRLGARTYIAGNPHALRSTHVRVLQSALDPVGPDNARHLREIIAEADILIPCWGSRRKLPSVLWPAVDALRETLFAAGKPLRIFGLTQSRDPLHPLMLSYETPLVEWTR